MARQVTFSLLVVSKEVTCKVNSLLESRLPKVGGQDARGNTIRFDHKVLNHGRSSPPLLCLKVEGLTLLPNYLTNTKMLLPKYMSDRVIHSKLRGPFAMHALCRAKWVRACYPNSCRAMIGCPGRRLTWQRGLSRPTG